MSIGFREENFFSILIGCLGYGFWSNHYDNRTRGLKKQLLIVSSG
jgi:hypothetical protein